MFSIKDPARISFCFLRRFDRRSIPVAHECRAAEQSHSREAEEVLGEPPLHDTNEWKQTAEEQCPPQKHTRPAHFAFCFFFSLRETGSLAGTRR